MKIELSGHYGYRRIVMSMAPMVATMVVISAYSIVDGVIVSNFVGNTAFAAMNLIWPVLSLIAAMGQMVGSGGGALVSKTLGEGRSRKACEIFSMLVRVTFAVGVLVSALLFIFMEQVVLALGSDPDMLPHAVSYGRIVACALPLYIIQMAFQSFYMTAEMPQTGTVVSIICGVLNIGLDLLFVLGFGWGLNGAAIATAISLSFGGLFPLCLFASRHNRSSLRFVPSGRDLPSLVRTCTNGMSEYVGNISLNIVGICYNLQLMKYVGENGVSAYGIIMYVAFIFAAIFIGYNTGISQIIAFNYGAGNRRELTSLLHKSLVLVGLGGLAMTLSSELLARLISGFFVSSDAALHDFATHAIRVYMFSFLLCGFNMFTSAWFTALNNGVVSAVSAFARTMIFELGAVFLLPALFGVDGIWLSVSVAELFAFAMSIILILSFRKRYGY